MDYTVVWQHTVPSLQRERFVKILEFTCASMKVHSIKISWTYPIVVYTLGAVQSETELCGA